MEPKAPSEEKILRFRTRGSAFRHRMARRTIDRSPVGDLGKYANRGETDDYGHRMRMNGLAILIVALLIGCGIWLVDAIAQLRKDQDCVLSGRRSCAPIDMPSNSR